MAGRVGGTGGWSDGRVDGRMAARGTFPENPENPEIPKKNKKTITGVSFRDFENPETLPL